MFGLLSWTIRPVLDDLWPTYRLCVTVDQVRLRLPREAELGALGALAAQGVHDPSERPFLTPWTDGTPDEVARAVLREHWGALAGWTVERWSLGLGVFAPDDEPLGMVTLRTRNFSVVREVTTSSWLGLRHQGQGFGSGARLGLLSLAFDHLRANSAVTAVFRDNHASQGVSRKLGYEPDGISVDARGSQALVSDRLRLTRERWDATSHPPVVVTGVDACRHMFEGGSPFR